MRMLIENPHLPSMTLSPTNEDLERKFMLVEEADGTMTMAEVFDETGSKKRNRNAYNENQEKMEKRFGRFCSC